jgi:hypothetical protein
MLNFHNFGNEFLDMISKAQVTKERIGKLDNMNFLKTVHQIYSI